MVRKFFRRILLGFLRKLKSAQLISSGRQDQQKNQEKTDALVCKYGSPRSAHDEYEILKFLGEGSFGKVAKCMKKGSKDIVAVKICKFPDFSVFYNECLILQKLNFNDPDKFNFVRNVENFMENNRFFMVFEMLDKSLCDLMEENKYRPLPMQGIRDVTKQLLIAQDKLRQLRIIHGDLKPENIMLVNHKGEPFRIKIIDFGQSIQLPTEIYPLGLGTLTYRAPEIILGLRYYEAVDMWSTGCIVAEMLMGEVLYPGFSSYDQIRFIDETQGPFPDYMLHSNKIAAKYFSRVRRFDGTEGKWRVKRPKEYLKDTGNESTDFRSYGLHDLVKVCSRVRRGYKEAANDRKYCVDMIKEMLEISHEDRIYPYHALRCNFISHGK